MSKFNKKQTTKAAFNPHDLYASMLDLDPDLKKELDSKNLVARWIDAKNFQEQYGFHRSNWKPYKREVKKSDTSSLFNGDPEGYIRRGSLILAVKTSEANELHKAKLQARANNYKDYNKLKARELKEMARSQGVDAKVFEGYDENGDEDSDSE